MAQRIDLRINYGKGREMGILHPRFLDEFFKGRKIVGTNATVDGTVVSFELDNGGILEFRTDLAIPTLAFDGFPKSHP